MEFTCYICKNKFQDQRQLEVHSLFDHGRYMQPCSTGVAEKQAIEEDQMRIEYKRLKSRITNKTTYIRREFRLNRYHNYFLKHVLYDLKYAPNQRRTSKYKMAEIQEEFGDRFLNRCVELAEMEIELKELKRMLDASGIIY